MLEHCGHDKRWKEVRGLGELVLHLFDLENPQPRVEVETLARQLAEAAKSLLGTFAPWTSGAEQFAVEKANEQRQSLLRQLRT